jgi:hypothetical protein
MRTRLRQLHSIVAKAADYIETLGTDIYPEVSAPESAIPETPEEKIARLFNGPVSPREPLPPVITPDDETWSDRDDEMLFWPGEESNGSVRYSGLASRGGNTMGIFPSVGLTEMVQKLNQEQRRGLALHLGLEEIMAEHAQEISDRVRKSGIRSVTIGPRNFGHTNKATFAHSGRAVPMGDTDASDD